MGESRRTGDFTHVICGESHPGHAAGCVGRFPARQKLALDFFGGTWQASAMSGPTTREVVPSCTDDAFDWDGAVARTGIMLLEPAKGAAVRSKLKAKSFTLVARYVENCDATFFGAGTCKTEWTYKANFRKAGKKKRRH